jgi:tetratricopeptide (TPR) repeat protein
MRVKRFMIGTVAAALIVGGVAIGPAAAQAENVPARAMTEFNAGRYRQAATILKEALKQHPDEAALYHWLSRSELELGDDEAAVKNGRRAVDRDPDQSEYHRWLGRAYGAQADRTHSFFTARKVKGEFEEAVRLDPENIAARRDAMEFYLEAPWIVGGGHDKARDEAKAIAAIDPVEGALADAACDANEGKRDEAAEDYERALGMKPARPGPYFEAAAFYAAQRNADRLQAVVATAREVAPTDPRVDYYHGVAEAIQGDRLETAEHALQTYLAHAPVRDSLPSHSSAHLWLGRVYERQGRMALAADQYRIALALNPDQDAAREALERVQHTW